MMDPKAAARALGGDYSGGQILVPGPGHSRHDRSLSVRFSADAPDGFVVHSFSSDDPIVCRDHVKAVLGIGREYRCERRRPEAPRPAVERAAQDKRNAALAAEVWSEGVPVMEHPIGRVYAKARNVDMGSAALRFHPACKTRIDGKLMTLPAIVAKLVPVDSIDTLIAIQRTFLVANGSGKADLPGGARRMLGNAAGAVCKLSPDEDVTTVLGIGEGVESTLSLSLIPEAHGVPVWATMSANALSAFPVFPGVEVLWIAVDNDKAGLEASAALSKRWREAGHEVFRVRPVAAKADINDIVKEARHG
jgi:hypothetical protein